VTAVGVDTYSFHRLLGEVRAGERPVLRSWDWTDAVRCCVALGADVVGLETCHLGAPGTLDVERLGDALGPAGAVFSWGHPYGLSYGSDGAAERDLLDWIDLAARCGHALLRVVVAHPHLRGDVLSEEQLRASTEALRRVTARAAAAGVVLAVENHADLTAAELLELVRRVDSPALAVCFDVVNAVRVRDDVVDAAALLADHVVMAHLKDLVDAPWHPASGPVTTAPGAGVLPVRSVVDVLVQGQRCRVLLVELGHLGGGVADEQELVASGLSWVRTALRTAA
jgi:sugar phosphate isomerase/epimerase